MFAQFAKHSWISQFKRSEADARREGIARDRDLSERRAKGRERGPLHLPPPQPQSVAVIHSHAPREINQRPTGWMEGLPFCGHTTWRGCRPYQEEKSFTSLHKNFMRK